MKNSIKFKKVRFSDLLGWIAIGSIFSVVCHTTFFTCLSHPFLQLSATPLFSNAWSFHAIKGLSMTHSHVLRTECCVAYTTCRVLLTACRVQLNKTRAPRRLLIPLIAWNDHAFEKKGCDWQLKKRLRQTTEKSGVTDNWKNWSNSYPAQ